MYFSRLNLGVFPEKTGTKNKPEKFTLISNYDNMNIYNKF
jgi:hypothetical protein